ncbi:MAG: glycogen debranching protein GlgX [Propionibacteriaceae bacterium]|jgi:glycogen operon protein|nr:glycogen debranching protein GlgX [Propionibacteriaceae bacterium]
MTQPLLPAPPDDVVLGPTVTDDGVIFTLWAPRATRVELALLTKDREKQENHDMTLGDGGVWSVHCPGIGPGQLYGFRVHGLWEPTTGQRFNPARLILDPYAKAITGGVDYSGPIHDHQADDDYLPDQRDSSQAVPLSVVVAPAAPPAPLAKPISPSERVILETHVKGYTIKHPSVPEYLRGTFAGMAYPTVIEHLKAVGVTTVELLPIHHFVSEPFVVSAGLSNYWGYNTLGFFAPHSAYASMGTLGEQVDEFKEMVTLFHEAGIEVFLDVVYNHTGEGSHEGPTLAFRGIDHAGYYRLTEDLRNDYDVTGCGNSVDTSQPGVLRLVLDSLRYWVTEMGIDGFRFDLATTLIRNNLHHVDQNHPFKQALASDPVLSKVTIIAEPWDIGPYGYQLGAWGPGWGEWNGKYRDYMRDYWRGVIPGVQELATRLAGSPDLFEYGGRKVTDSINFITAHDGFTLRDLVSYNGKHNEANNEGNRDGTNDNRSWNCGAEGETDDEGIVKLRQRQVRNFLMTMMFTHGTPMITAGDEIGRSQQGNNNAYCQDSPISWVSWADEDTWGDIATFLGNVAQVRAAHPVLRPEVYMQHEDVLDADGNSLHRPELAWLDGDDGEMGPEDWADQGRKLLGMFSSNADEAMICWFYAGADPVTISLPPSAWGAEYRVLLHSGEPDEFPVSGETLHPGDQLTIPGRTTVVMQSVLPTSADELAKASADASAIDEKTDETDATDDIASTDAGTTPPTA